MDCRVGDRPTSTSTALQDSSVVVCCDDVIIDAPDIDGYTNAVNFDDNVDAYKILDESVVIVDIIVDKVICEIFDDSSIVSDMDDNFSVLIVDPIKNLDVEEAVEAKIVPTIFLRSIVKSPEFKFELILVNLKNVCLKEVKDSWRSLDWTLPLQLEPLFDRFSLCNASGLLSLINHARMHSTT